MEYGYICAGYTPPETGWYSVKDCLPLMDDDTGGILRSRPVLLCLGDHQLVGYLQQWDEMEFVAEWKLSGRDGYDAENVTHWQWLPLAPNDKVEPRHDSDVGSDALFDMLKPFPVPLDTDLLLWNGAGWFVGQYDGAQFREQGSGWSCSVDSGCKFILLPNVSLSIPGGDPGYVPGDCSVSLAEHQEKIGKLYDAGLDCCHELDKNCMSGVRCTKCGGWYCL